MNPEAFQSVQEEYAREGGVRSVFTTKVADYVVARPGYPAALYEALRSRGTMVAGATVADIGAGTGLFSRGLLEWECSVIAVEPNAGMRAEADAMLGNLAGYRSVGGGAEDTTLEDASVDLVTAAQAFHWFDPVATRIEWLRILKPAGQVALVWNDRSQDDPLQSELDRIFEEFGGEKREARAAYDHKAGVETFFRGGTMEVLEFPHEHRMTRSGLRSLALSRSYMPTAESEAGKKVMERVDGVFEKFAGEELVTIRYRTRAYLGRPGN